jgi:arsenate reductase
MPHPPFQVLVLCTGNSARSQVAEALLATKGAGRIVAGSAGSHPAARVHPGAVAVLARNGIAWEGKVPKTVDEVAGTAWDLLITVCDHANESCPIFPGTPPRVHWGLPDPAHVEGEAANAAAFETTYRALDGRIAALLALPLETLGRGELEQLAREIHTART